MALEKIGLLAKKHNIPTSRIRDSITQGKLKGEKQGDFWVVDVNDFDDWMGSSLKNSTPKSDKSVRKTKPSLSCPQCGGVDLKTAEVTISSGTYSGESKMTGVGVGLDGGVAVGFGKNKINYQSDLAKNVNKVDEKNLGQQMGGCLGSFMGIVLGVLIGISSQSFGVGIIVMFVCTGVGMALGSQSGVGKIEQTRIVNEKARFKNSLVCQTCGHQFEKR